MSQVEDEADGQIVVLADAETEEQEQLRSDDPLQELAAEVISTGSARALAHEGELRAAIEAMLFASSSPAGARKIAEAIGKVEISAVRRAIKELTIEYDARGGGIQISEVAGGYQMGTREKYAEFVARLVSKRRRPALSNAALETLAIVAYRQPVIRADVESVRGVESSGTLRNLLDLGLLEVVGRKEVIGRPPMYGTTHKFLATFGLKRLKDLPSIQGLRDRFIRAEPAKQSEDAQIDSGEEKIDQPVLDLAGDAAHGETATQLEPAEKDELSAESSQSSPASMAEPGEPEI